jgi:hypothetical protein
MQAGVAELVKIVAIRVNEMLREGNYKTRLIMQYHDALILSVVADEAGKVLPRILWIMETVLSYQYCDIEGQFVLFSADINHYENAHKWGYDPNEPYPFPMFVDGDTDKPNTVTIPRDEVIDTLRKRAIDEIVQEIVQIAQKISILLQQNVPYVGYKNHRVVYDALSNHSLDDIVEQAGKWLDAQQLGLVTDNAEKQTIHAFVEIAQKLATLRRRHEYLNHKLVELS